MDDSSHTPVGEAKPNYEARLHAQRAEKSGSVAPINPDLRIDVDLGATLPVGQFGNVRPALGIKGIDPYGDVERQITVSLAAGATAFLRINDTIRELVDDKLVSENETGTSLSERVAALEKFEGLAKANITKLAEMVRRAASPETPKV